MMIDIHCHILPGVDDGPDNLGTAVKMAEQALNSGIDTIIATPHFLTMVYDTNLAKLGQATRLLCDALAHRDIKLRIFTGAEIRLAHNVCELIDNGMLPSLAGSCYYLFELPDIFIKDSIIRVLRQMRDRGIVPVIAHPERNHTIMKNPGIIRDLKFEKAKFQLTGQSVVGKNGKLSKTIARQMILDDTADFIASDGHDLEFRKPCLNNLYKVVNKISNKRMAQKILIENPKCILETVLKTDLNFKKVG